MDAIIMPSTTSLIAKLQADYSAVSFTAGDEFRWSPDETTVYYDASANDQASLLHELAHALLGHADYSKDISLIEMERDAWQYAKGTLGPAYNVEVADATAQDALDTYRDWLHARSVCPTCQATGIQIKKQVYKCLACGGQWRVNEARVCALRRYKVIP